MITYKKQPNTTEQITELLCKPVKKWFFSQFKEFSLPQLYGVFEIHSRNNVLISAPTGATKTLTAFLAIVNQLVDLAQKEKLEDKIYAVYVSPLKALNYDIEHNLQEPLKAITKLAAKAANIRVGVRTGDTTAYQRQKQSKIPPHILITTPESLALLLANEKQRYNLSKVEWFITDEVHALANNKRGTQLSLLLEQLVSLTEFTRVGLSATIAPLEDIAQFVAGKRDCKIIHLPMLKNIELTVTAPATQLIETPYEFLQEKIFEQLHDSIQSHKSVLLFTNTRAATERLVFGLKQRYPKDYYEIDEEPPFARSALIGAHHGSLSKLHRNEIEERLRKGKLRAVVCSTSLELGIDIGFIDHVILLSSPKGVARLIQRVGRSGHQLHTKSHGTLIAQDRDELVEVATLNKLAKEKSIDSVRIPTLCYDVLCQYIVGRVIIEPIKIDMLYAEVTKSFAFFDLTKTAFLKCIHSLSETDRFLEKHHMYPKIIKKEDTLYSKGNTVKRIYLQNAGTIADSGAISVKRGDHILGYVDESFVESLKPSDVFVLGGEAYRFKYARGMTIQVAEAHKSSPTVPQWYSQRLTLTYDAAVAIVKVRDLARELFDKKKTQKEWCKEFQEYLHIPLSIAQEIYWYLKEQYDVSIVPNHNELLVEQFVDGREVYTFFHTLYGAKVNEALGSVFAHVATHTVHGRVKMQSHDNGFYLLTLKQFDMQQVCAKMSVDNIEGVFSTAIAKTEHIKRRFRHCATRSLLLLRSYKGHRKTVGQQQLTSHMILSAVRSSDPQHPVLLETEREVLEDVMNTPKAKEILKKIVNKSIKIVQKKVEIPSPFSVVLLSQSFPIKIQQAYKKEMHQQSLALISIKQKESFEYPKPVNYEEYWEK